MRRRRGGGEKKEVRGREGEGGGNSERRINIAPTSTPVLPHPHLNRGDDCGSLGPCQWRDIPILCYAGSPCHSCQSPIRPNIPLFLVDIYKYIHKEKGEEEVREGERGGRIYI